MLKVILNSNRTSLLFVLIATVLFIGCKRTEISKEDQLMFDIKKYLYLANCTSTGYCDSIDVSPISCDIVFDFQTVYGDTILYYFDLIYENTKECHFSPIMAMGVGVHNDSIIHIIIGSGYMDLSNRNDFYKYFSYKRKQLNTLLDTFDGEVSEFVQKEFIQKK